MASKTLSIELQLESKSFAAHMQKVNDAFEKSNKDLQKFGKNLQKVGAGMAAVGASITAALGVAVKSLANAADTADDTAKRTGLTVEAVQELGYVAKMTGSDLGTVEIALRTMQRNLVDTGTESAAFTGALERLGLKLADLRKMNPQEQFDALSKAIAGVQDSSQRAGLAMTVFGRSGTALLPMLAEGAAGISKFKDEAHKYGYVMNQEVANAGSNFNDNLDRLKGAVGGLAQQVAAGLLPGLNSLVRSTADVVAGFKAWINENPGLVSALAKTAAGIGAAVTVFGALVAACGTWITLAPAVGAAWTVATGPIGVTVMAIAAVVAGIVALYKNWDTVCHYMAQAWDALTVVICKGVEMWLASWETALGWIPGIGEKLRTAMYAVQDASAQAAFDIGQRQLQYEKDKNEKLMTETQKFTSAQNELLLNAQTEQHDIASQKTDEHLTATAEQVAGFWQAVYEVSEAQSFNISDAVGTVYENLQKNLSTSFQALFQQIGNGWSGLKDIAVNLCQSMYNSFTKMLADIAAEQIKNIIAVQVANSAAAKLNVAANAAEAGSKAAASSAGWALWGAVAIGAGIMAAVLAFADGFATGGIVPGNSFSGDNVLARVNSGEMILNSAQQARLFDIADGKEGVTSSGGAVINQTINVNGGGDLAAITQAIKRGTTEALEFANVAYKAGAKRNKYVG